MIFAQNHPPAASTPDITDFYRQYILLQSAEKPSTARIDSLLRQYCTDSLIHNIKSGKYDYDIILQAQDCDLTWAQYVFPADNDRDGIYYTDPNAKTIASISVQRDAEGKIKDVTLCDVLDIRYRKSIDHKMFCSTAKKSANPTYGAKKRLLPNTSPAEKT
ncbi:MAG: hypothetical protein K2J66_08590 [Muribaculaceae bacterium]|nr:hypothetical protein [Muribaculaceae bacterium]